jgi:hypothetical protein
LGGPHDRDVAFYLIVVGIVFIVSALYNQRGAEQVNRFFRRMQRFGKSFSPRRTQGEMSDAQHKDFEAHTPQDVTSVRAKSTGHGKKTADKWNQ